MKFLSRLLQKSLSSNTRGTSCCEQTQFDCNQGRNCPLRATPASPTCPRTTPTVTPGSTRGQSQPVTPGLTRGP
jgi:hypothetical protein